MMSKASSFLMLKRCEKKKEERLNLLFQCFFSSKILLFIFYFCVTKIIFLSFFFCVPKRDGNVRAKVVKVLNKFSHIKLCFLSFGLRACRVRKWNEGNDNKGYALCITVTCYIVCEAMHVCVRVVSLFFLAEAIRYYNVTYLNCLCILWK